MRTLTEILKDVDLTESIKDLLNLEKELLKNKKKYSLVELEFAEEHMINRCNQIAKKDNTSLLSWLNNIDE